METVNHETIQDLASTLNLLGDTVRLSILTQLIDEPSTVTNIVKNLDVSQPLVSHHLRVLKDSKIVKATKSGKHVIYTLVDSNVKNILELAFSKAVN